MFIIQSIRPGPLDRREMRRAFEQGMVKVADLIESDFKSTVQTWENKPEFETVSNLNTPNRIDVFVYTENQIYGWINNGVDPHIIGPRDADVLAFHEGYTAQTDPGVIQLGNTFLGNQGMSLGDSVRSVESHEGGESGGMVFVRGEVNHPGIEPRNFDMRIRLKRTGDVQKIMEDAAGVSAKRSGHWLGNVRVVSGL